MKQQDSTATSLPRIVGALRGNEAELRAAGIKRLWIVGSVARAESTLDSDIDISVEIDPHAHLGLRFFGLEERLSSLLGRTVQLLPEPVENPQIRASIERDRVVVF
jgi:uncharacterized protein